MVARKASLQHKVLLGYMILIMAVCGMVSILLYERSRMREIKTETSEIRRIRHDISTAHRYITELATYGESVIVWEDTDFREYRRKRLQTDSLLQILKVSCGTFVLPKQIDSLCHLLEAKEIHLLRIMETITRQGEADSLLANRLPIVIREAVRTRTVTQKKKGIAGWFGGKRSVQVFEPSKGLQDLNEKLIAMQEERERRIDMYTDSLRIQNKALNRKLQILITHLDGQAQAAFISREEKITEAGDFSFKLFVLVIVSASSLLFISFLIIRHDIRKEREGRAQLQRINRENEELLGMRKQIILTISHDIRGPLGNINNCVELTYSGEVAASLGVYFKTEVNIAYCGGPFVKVGPSVSTDLSASVVTGSDYQFKVNTSGKFKLAGKTGAELHIVGYSLGKWETEYVLAEKDAWNKEFIVDMWPK